MKVAIIGAGAAGCFCAIALKRNLPEADVTVIERSRRPLAKVSITGGGRCNLTNSFRQISDLRQAYPRGARLMQRIFRKFSPQDTYEWWEHEGVKLTTQADECVFPQSQNAMEIVNTLLRLMKQLGVRLLTESTVYSILPLESEKGEYSIIYGHQQMMEKETEASNMKDVFDFLHSKRSFASDFVVISSGGAPRPSKLSFLSPLQLEIIPPVPSLFALNVGDEGLHALSGAVIEKAHVSIAGTKLKAEGPLLITHFGMSGPAILRLSSYGARLLAEQAYHAPLLVNWMEGQNEDEVRQTLMSYMHSNKQVLNLHPRHLTARHWAYLLHRASIPESLRWDALNTKELNRLTTTLTADTYPIQGRCPYKEEFVTSGGVALNNVNPSTLELRSHPHIYLAGEVLDVDAITGGFNLQAAWSMGYVVAQSISAEINNEGTSTT